MAGTETYCLPVALGNLPHDTLAQFLPPSQSIHGSEEDSPLAELENIQNQFYNSYNFSDCRFLSVSTTSFNFIRECSFLYSLCDFINTLLCNFSR